MARLHQKPCASSCRHPAQALPRSRGNVAFEALTVAPHARPRNSPAIIGCSFVLYPPARRLYIPASTCECVHRFV
eukprot:742239-Amphidinium_carterae.1